MTDVENRLCRLEQQLRANDSLITAQQIALAQLVQAVRTQQPGGYGGGGGGGTQGFMGQATVNIGARTGATLAAGGNVDAYKDVSGTLTSVGVSVTARCAVSRTTVAGNGIDSGTWCWVEQDPFGTYWASPLDCT